MVSVGLSASVVLRLEGSAHLSPTHALKSPIQSSPRLPLDRELADHLSDQHLVRQLQPILQVLPLKYSTPVEKAIHGLPLAGLELQELPLQVKLVVLGLADEVRLHCHPGKMGRARDVNQKRDISHGSEQLMEDHRVRTLPKIHLIRR
jgi:hypothetical protein